MLFSAIVKKYTSNLILLVKFKGIIGMKEKSEQNMEVPFSVIKFLIQTHGTFGRFFCLKFYLIWWFLGE